MRIKTIAVAVCATALMAGAFASSASAQTQQRGLVNVAVEDVIVQVPVSVAANVCDVNVAVLATVADQAAGCEATADSTATAGPNSNNGSTRQNGLVNVLLDDVLVQVPVSVAANICDVNVAVLAQIADQAAACRATAESAASPGPGQANGNGIFIPIDISGGGFTPLDNNTATDGGAANLVSPGTALVPLPAGLTLL
jgi:hypothetical protein